MKQKTFTRVLALCLICGLCACGGDGSGGSTATKAAEPKSGVANSLLDKGKEILTELTPEPEKVHGLIFVDYMGIVRHRVDGAHVVGTYNEDGTPVRSVDPADISGELPLLKSVVADNSRKPVRSNVFGRISHKPKMAVGL